MMMFLNVIPFIIIIALFLVASQNRKQIRMGGLVYNKAIRIILSVYALVLISATVIFYTISYQYASTDIKINQEDIWVRNHENTDLFYDAMWNGLLDSSEYAYINGQWDFEYKKDQLIIPESSYMDYSEAIIVKTGDVDDMIRIVHYVPKYIVETFDIGDEIKAPKVALKENILNITSPQYYEIEINSFKKDFTVLQFMSEKNDSNGDHIRMMAPHIAEAIYMYIPENLKINAPNSNIIYIEENRDN